MSEPTKGQIDEFKRLMKWYHEESTIPLVPLEALRAREEYNKKANPD